MDVPLVVQLEILHPGVFGSVMPCPGNGVRTEGVSGVEYQRNINAGGLFDGC